MEAMTLEQVRDWHRKKAREKDVCGELMFPGPTESPFYRYPSEESKQHDAIADAIDAHLAQPAQAVDVTDEMVELAHNRYWSTEELRGDDRPAIRAALEEVAPFFTRALSGEKAGPVGDGWQPIETAPKDGTHIWLGATHEMRVGFWHQSWEHWVDYHAAESGSPRSLRFDPTVWQPLPASPTPDKEG